jgi:hypothetical protein
MSPTHAMVRAPRPRHVSWANRHASTEYGVPTYRTDIRFSDVLRTASSAGSSPRGYSSVLYLGSTGPASWYQKGSRQRPPRSKTVASRHGQDGVRRSTAGRLDHRLHNAWQSAITTRLGCSAATWQYVTRFGPSHGGRLKHG